jgi:hypothetical protein
LFRQSAPKFVGVHNFDPLERRALAVEASAGCLIIVATFEPPALVAGFDDVALMHQAVFARGKSARGKSARGLFVSANQLAHFRTWLDLTLPLNEFLVMASFTRFAG